MPQLRAALGLCRAESERGTELLRAAYETFTEGFTTRDLIEAKELLG
jgi:predicted ATPase